MKKVAMVHFSTRDSLHEKKDISIDRDSFGSVLLEYEEWREPIFGDFAVMDKLYVDFPRMDSQAVVRAISYVADKLQLAINGGMGKWTVRSFADSGKEKRRRIFLARGPYCTTSKLDIVIDVKNSLSLCNAKGLAEGW